MSDSPFAGRERITVYESDYSHFVVVFENGEPIQIEHTTTLWVANRRTLSARLLKVIDWAKEKRDEYRRSKGEIG